MKQLKKVWIEDAPGYEDFGGWEYDRFGQVDERGELSIILDIQNNIVIIPSGSVTYVTSTENSGEGAADLG